MSSLTSHPTVKPARSLDHHRRGYGAQHHMEDAAHDEAAEVSTEAPIAIEQPHQRCSADYALHARLRCTRVDSTERPALNRARNRLMLAASVFVCAGFVVGARLVEVALSPQESGRGVASVLEGDHRADITDRNGVLLATQVQTASLFADPAKVMEPLETARQIASVLPEINEDRLAEKLGGEGRFVWVKRNLTPAQHEAVHRLGLPGIGVRNETKRFYPQGNSFAHLIGFTSIDNEGLSGIEQEFDERLRHEDEPLKLSVDVRVQEVLRTALKDAMDEFRAVGATGIVMDARNGEVVAMSSLPDFDPMQPAAAPPEHRFNRAVQGVYELGSTFKISPPPWRSTAAA